MSTLTTRRQFVVSVISGATALSVGSLAGCGGGSDDDDAPEFLYGVASGDPLADRVILWTHAKYAGSDDPVDLVWEVAGDNAFADIVASGSTTATAATGHAVKVDAGGLEAGRDYFYRFRRGRDASPVGLTRTLPAADVSEVRFAVMSCSNYPAGFFNVYAEVAKSDAQYALHLGDYIYEYEAGGYASDRAEQMGRVSEPANELLTLEHYRHRHAQYKSDPDSKTLHAKMPLIAVWDDHEIANDAWKDGAENHDPATEGDFAARKAAAIQAYHEWLPIRSGADRTRIWRRFDFGSLVSLHMLDTRSFGRERQVSLAALAGADGAPARAEAMAAYTSPTRQLLGAEQLAWLQDQLADSRAAWQVLGQQVLMARMEAPVSVLAVLTPENLATEQGRQLALAAVQGYLTAKATPAGQRTPEQAALMDPARNPLLGYNLDAWDGYLAARETVLATALALGKRLVSLAGDTHNAWHADLTLKGLSEPTLAGVKAGEEFATTSVSSPGLETYLAGLPPEQVKAVFEGIVDDLSWMDPARRGYLKMRFTADRAVGQWFFVDTVTSRGYTASLGHERSWSAG